MKQTEQGCGLSIRLGCILIVLLISFSLVLADGNTTTTETTTTTNSTTTTIDGNTTTTVNTTTTIDGNTTTTTVTTTTIEDNETNETSTHISVEYDSGIEEGETSLIKVTYTWGNGTVEEASGTIEYNDETYDLEFEDSTQTYDYPFSEAEGSYDFYVEISKEGFEPQYFNGTIEVEPAETTTTTSTTTSATTTSIVDYSTSLVVNVPSSVYSNESAEFKINYTTESGPVTDADVILEISHEEINLITNESYVYTEAYFVPWSSFGFYYYSLDLEIGLYNYFISATKEGLEPQEYRGDMVVKAVEEENEEPKGEEYFIDFENKVKTEEQDIPEESLKAGLPIEEAGYSELTTIFILFGFMCAQVAVIVFILYRNMKKEEEIMKFLLIMMMLSNSDEEEGFFGDFL